MRTIRVYRAGAVLDADGWRHNGGGKLRYMGTVRPRPSSEVAHLAQTVALAELLGVPVGQIVDVRDEPAQVQP